MWLRFNLILKRFFDICSSACAIVLLIPLWIIVAIAIKRGSDGPILFKQGRRTKDGRIFMMWKYRSMVVNAENIGSGWNALFAQPKPSADRLAVCDPGILDRLIEILISSLTLFLCNFGIP